MGLSGRPGWERRESRGGSVNPKQGARCLKRKLFWAQRKMRKVAGRKGETQIGSFSIILKEALWGVQENNDLMEQREN